MENNVQSPQYQPPVAPEQKPSNGLAIAFLVLGILSIIMVFVYAWVGIICAIVGIVLAVVAKKQNPSGLATAGLVLSIIALAICIISIIAVIASARRASGHARQHVTPFARTYRQAFCACLYFLFMR